LCLICRHKKPYVEIELLHPLGFKYDLWSLVYWVDWDEEEEMRYRNHFGRAKIHSAIGGGFSSHSSQIKDRRQFLTS
jgi:hypothetical protein